MSCACSVGMIKKGAMTGAAFALGLGVVARDRVPVAVSGRQQEADAVFQPDL